MNGHSVAGECRWCGRKDEDNPGDYYHEKDCHRKDVLRRMDALDAVGVGDLDPRREHLERELFAASYTGD